MNRHKNQLGFTLIEAVLSSLILAVGAVVVCGLAQRYMFSYQHGAEYEIACRLLDECLEKITVPDNNVLAEHKTISGDFGQQYPRYDYLITIEPAETHGLYQVTAQVNWKHAGLMYKVTTSTRIFDFNY